MKRREFITLLGGAAAAWPLEARAQQPSRTLRVGTASPNSRAFIGWAAFDQRLRELGWIEGQNLAFEFIDTRDQADRVSGAIQRTRPAQSRRYRGSSGNEQGLKAALAATGTVPIVIIAIQYDPVALGHVE